MHSLLLITARACATKANNPKPINKLFNSNTAMKTKNSLGLLYNLLLGVVIALIAGFGSIGVVFFGLIAITGGELMHVVKVQNKASFFEGLGTEVWLADVMEDFYPTNTFLAAARDLSALVDNDKINFAEAGADPAVLKNNTVYPINATVAGDTPKEIVLDYYDTESSIVRNAVAIEQAYDQRMLYIKKHQKALLKKLGIDAAWAYAPQVNNATNPVLSLAANDSVIDGVIDLQRAYNDLDDDGTNRNLVLCPAHMAKIAKEDKALYKNIMAKPGDVYMSFKIWSYSKNPIYVTATNQKAALGTAFVPGTHKLASFSFLGDEVMKALGTFKFFSNLNDPAQKGDVFNYQMRGLVASMRGKYSGAILQ
jgi:hypothetical protein